jgi:hypothetical protein
VPGGPPRHGDEDQPGRRQGHHPLPQPTGAAVAPGAGARAAERRAPRGREQRRDPERSREQGRDPAQEQGRPAHRRSPAKLGVDRAPDDNRRGWSGSGPRRARSCATRR